MRKASIYKILGHNYDWDLFDPKKDLITESLK